MSSQPIPLRPLAPNGFFTRSLAEAVARSMAPDGAVPNLRLPEGQAYCVVGSTDPITLAQLQYLRESDAGLAFIAAPNGVAPERLPSTARLTVIQAVPGTAPASGAAVAAALGQSLLRLEPAPGSLLILSGGATAQIILGQLGIRVLEIMGETLPGLPLAHGGGLTVVTKSGGFGDRETLSRLTAPYRSTESAVHSHVG